MIKLPALLLAAGSVLAATRAAAAQPGAQPAPAPPAASQTPPAGGDRSVSQIQGTPVPVGEHHQYYYEYPRLNLSTNPLGWIFGIYGVSASYGLTRNLAVRADFNYFDFIDSDESGVELGVGLPIYLRRTYSGAFVEPGFIVREFSDDDTTTLGPQVLIGWHWIWDSGLNLAIAAGAGRNWSNDDDEESSYDDEEIFGNGYIRFGYAF